MFVAALKAGVSGIDDAVSAARSKLAKASGETQSLALGAVASAVTIDATQLLQAIKQLYGDSYLVGAHAAAQQIGGGAILSGGIEGLAADVNWDGWEPGHGEAAAKVADGGLADLLNQADVTVKGISDTLLSRLGNVLGDGLAAGDSVDTIGRSLQDIVDDPDRAWVIADTESARAMVQASLDTYKASGVDQWNWLAEDDACEICLGYEDDNPHDLDDAAPPAHPRCRCATQPIVDTGSSDDSDDGDDAE